MKYTFEKAEKSTVKITITLSAEEWKQAISSAYEKTKGKYSLPGFRKGKVPKHLLEATYGEGVFYEEAINIAFPKYYGEVLDKEPSIEAVAHPDVDIKKIDEKGLVIEAVVAVKPPLMIEDPDPARDRIIFRVNIPGILQIQDLTFGQIPDTDGAFCGIIHDDPMLRG